jgi:hypothetical protein
MTKQDDVLKILLTVGDERPKRNIHMKRFGVDFTIQAIDGKAVSRIREQSTFTTKKGKEIDEEKFGMLLIEKGCENPKWNDKALVDKYGSVEQAIQTTLLAGEIAKLSAEILELSGFNEDEDDIKN